MSTTTDVRILFCGSREIPAPAGDVRFLRSFIRCLLVGFQTLYTDRLVVVHGAAKGIDNWVAGFADDLGIRCEPYPAEWREHHPDWCPGNRCATSGKSYCVAAGPRRNQTMLDSRISLAVAIKHPFNWRLDKGGTEDMAKRCHDAEVPVMVVEPW